MKTEKEIQQRLADLEANAQYFRRERSQAESLRALVELYLNTERADASATELRWVLSKSLRA